MSDPIGMREWLRGSIWSMRRAAGLSPTQRLFRELSQRGVRTHQLRALEVFGGTGDRHTIDYVGKVARLDVWELDPRRSAALRRNLPTARILNTDSFEEVRSTSERYDLVVVDNTITPYGAGRVEHFDLFPAIFRIVRDPGVLVLNVCPHVLPEWRHDALLKSRRASFYATDDPLDVPVSRMVDTYARLMMEHGRTLDWSFHIRRAYRSGIHYLALRMSSAAGRSSTNDA
jgi:hypothetical protein